MLKNKLLALNTILGFIFCTPQALAHGGGLDQNGGHFNRSTVIYHCHRLNCNNSTINDSSTIVSYTNILPNRNVVVAEKSETIRTAQYLLATLGYPVGSIDGIYGQQTEIAVKSYQTQAGIYVDGKIDDELLTTLSENIYRLFIPSN